jgi:thiol-disulfide isomerase/thioredoxin
MKLASLFALLLLSYGRLSDPAVASTTQASPSLAPLYTHSDWLREHVTSGELRGKVVLVDVFTFGCYNCANVRPNLQSLYKKRGSDLVVIGVHTPETPYERDRANVVANLAKQGVVWPVAIDNDQTLWNDFNVDAWPTQLIFDRHGVLRKTIVGDSQDNVVNAEVAKLIAERD